MLKTLSHYWWLVVLRGVLAMIFGILAFVWPDITIGALVLLFGIYALVDGISALASGIANRTDNRRWWVLLLEGIAGIAAGIIAFVWTGITAVVLLYVIAAWALVTGVMEIAAAFALREEIDGEWALGLSGLASIIFGFIFFFNPGAGALALVWIIGAYAILFGALLIYLGFNVRDLNVPVVFDG
ncbi:MAG: HdeD family acid-resistance protein [Anaerolineae bacterium]